jgi:hypothetical protein
MVIDGRELNFNSVRVRKVDSIGTSRAVRLQSGSVQRSQNGIRVEVLDCDALVVETGARVLEQGQEVLTQPEKAVGLGLVNHRQAEQLPVEVPGAWDVGYANRNVIQPDALLNAGVTPWDLTVGHNITGGPSAWRGSATLDACGARGP